MPHEDLTDDILLRICGVPADEEQKLPELLADLRHKKPLACNPAAM